MGIGATFDTWGGAALAGGILIGAGMGAAGGGGLFGRGHVNWEGFVKGGVIGGVSGAVGGGSAVFFSGVFSGSLGGMAATGLISGLASNVASQATANVLGVQSGWDWWQLGAAGLGGLLGGALSGGLTRGMMRDGQVICGTSPTKWFTLSVTGDVLGNAVGDGLDQLVRMWHTEAEWDWAATAQSVGMGLIMGLGSAHTQWKHNKACFSGDTPLLTPDGSRRIDELQVGDLVLARDEHDLFGVVAPRAVEEVFVRFGRIMHLHVGGQVIRTTAEHPFYAEGRGWTPAGELLVGERLATHAGGWVAVEDLLDTGEHEHLYNLRVAEWHTYFVGAMEWGWSLWAHNSYDIGNFPWHHEPTQRVGRVVQSLSLVHEEYVRTRYDSKNPLHVALHESLDSDVGTKSQIVLSAVLHNDEASSSFIFKGHNNMPTPVEYVPASHGARLRQLQEMAPQARAEGIQRWARDPNSRLPMHPEIETRVTLAQAFLDSGARVANEFGEVGAHAEVIAANQALWMRELSGFKVTQADFGNLLVANRTAKPTYFGGYGQPFPCDNCRPVMWGAVFVEGRPIL